MECQHSAFLSKMVAWDLIIASTWPLLINGLSFSSMLPLKLSNLFWLPWIGTFLFWCYFKVFSLGHFLFVLDVGRRMKTGEWVTLYTLSLTEGGWKSAFHMLKVMTKLLLVTRPLHSGWWTRLYEFFPISFQNQNLCTCLFENIVFLLTVNTSGRNDAVCRTEKWLTFEQV